MRRSSIWQIRRILQRFSRIFALLRFILRKKWSRPCNWSEPNAITFGDGGLQLQWIAWDFKVRRIQTYPRLRHQSNPLSFERRLGEWTRIDHQETIRGSRQRMIQHEGNQQNHLWFRKIKEIPPSCPSYDATRYLLTLIKRCYYNYYYFFESFVPHEVIINDTNSVKNIYHDELLQLAPKKKHIYSQSTFITPLPMMNLWLQS